MINCFAGGLSARTQVQTAKEAAKGLGRLILIYGTEGAGKTTLAATLCDHEEYNPVMMIDIDGSADAVEDRDNMIYERVYSFAEYKSLQNYVMNHPEEFKSIIIDGLTGLQEKYLQSINPNNEPKTWDHWNKNDQEMQDILRKWKKWCEKTGNIVFFSAWEVEDTDEISKLTIRRRNTAPKLAKSSSVFQILLAILINPSQAQKNVFYM